MNAAHDLSRLLITKARGDVATVLRLVGDHSVPACSLGLHAHHAAEQALKAVLGGHAVAYPRTHNLSLLIELLRRHDLPLPPDADGLPRLTPFGMAFHCDDELDGATRFELDPDWTAECVKRTVHWAANMV